MKKELLFVVDEREMGGVSVVLNDLVHLLDSKLFQIDILVLHNKGNMLQQLPKNTRLIYGTPYFSAIDYSLSQVLHKKDLSLIMKKLRVIFDLKTGFIKKRIVKERKKIINKKYDVEIAFKDGFCALFTAYGNSPKKIHWLHCAYKTFNPNVNYPTLFQDALKRFDHIVGVATNVVKEFNELYHLENKTEVVPVAMDVERIQSLASQPSKFEVDEKKLNFVCVGRSHPVKGYDRLFDVISRLKKENQLQDVCFHIFGDGPLYEHLLKRIHDENLESCIQMYGSVTNPYAEMKQHHCLLLPSFSEAFGTVISEAFILGVPVLATDTSASQMSIKHSMNGWICENSEQGIYDELLFLIQHPEELLKGKDYLKDFEYDNQKILGRITQLLTDKGE